MAQRKRTAARRAGRRRPSRRVAPLLAILLLLGFGAIALERAGVLPEPVGTIVRQADDWLDPVLREIGLDLPLRRDEGMPSESGAGGVDSRPFVIQALALLPDVEIAPERRAGYEREDWPHWLDLDGDCMDARDEVLTAESLEPVRLSADGCDVLGGLWRDLYTGETYRDPTRLDVDHLVPLAEAHRSGGHVWSRERRAAFASDLEEGRSLIAVSASANRSKSDQGPEEWLPPQAAYRCRYAADWVAVKVRWGLSMDERERVTISNLLGACARR